MASVFAWLKGRRGARGAERSAATPAGTDPEALRRQGDSLLQSGALDQAESVYRQVVGLCPDDAKALTSLGFTLLQKDALDEAARHLQRAAGIDTAGHDAHYLLGTLHERRGEADTAIVHFAIAAERAPDFEPASLDLGRLLASAGRIAEAKAALERGVARCPGAANVHFYLGNLHVLEERLSEAAASYGAAVEVDPAHLPAALALGNLRIRQGRTADIVAAFRIALAIDPDHQSAGTNLGQALLLLGRPAEAFEVLSHTVRSHGDVAAVHNNLGNALVELGRAEEAIAHYERAVALDPDEVDVLVNMGNALATLRRPREAIAAFERARAIDPDTHWLAGALLHTRLSICNWQGIEAEFADLARRIDAGLPAAVPFATLAVPLTAAQQQRCSMAYAERSAFPPQIELARRPPGKRIRLGYFSADFHGHATAYLMAELFEKHDRSRFEVIAFSFGPDSRHPMRQRLVAAFDRFIDVSGRSDAEICELARSLDIDLAIDLKGYTQDARTAIFSQRAAPIQVNFIGYPGTMGVPFIDYLIADRIVVPAGRVASYTEKIVWLPDSYQVNDSRRQVAERDFGRAEVGLPETGFVFCCFNNSYKITPDLFDVWMRLLSSVPGSVLWLLQDNALGAANLRAEAAARGVAPERLIFASRMEPAEHLARQRLADLFLDTLYCNAHTTASDALWVGLPVLTCPGETFASRVAASLLHALDLPELAVATLADYEREALAWAMQPERLAQIRHRLAARVGSSRLFDAARYARHVEAAYEAMQSRYVAGLAPDHIDVGESVQ